MNCERRRDWEIETRSEKGVKSWGTRRMARITSVPATAKSAQARRRAKASSASEARPATTTGPARVTASGAARYPSPTHLQLIAVVGDRARLLTRGRSVGRGARDDGQEPEEEHGGRHDDRRQGQGGRDGGRAPRRAHRDPDGEERRERDGDEDDVRRVHDGDGERGRGQRDEQPPVRSGPQAGEREREQDRHEQEPGRRGGQRERVERADAAPREPELRDLRDERGDAARPRAEEHPSRRVRRHERERDEEGGEVKRRRPDVDPREPGDERHDAVPEREGVAGVEPSVPVLVGDVHGREHVRLGELARAGQVHERIARADGLGRPPDEPGEDDPAAEHGPERDPLGSLAGHAPGHGAPGRAPGPTRAR